jgi:beta-galactosidase
MSAYMKNLLLIILAFFSSSISALAQREFVSLNGTWDIEESVSGDKVPAHFGHTVEVPGLANMSKPAFVDVDKFYSREYYGNSAARPGLIKLNINEDTMKIGYSFQKRNYFWYHKTFENRQAHEVVLLKINKAQFGTVVWINGKKAGEYNGCFTAQYYNITSLLKKNGKNEVLIRIGAHPGVLAPAIPAGDDFEKRHWTPGIYDDVSVIFTNYPYIEKIQIATDIHKGAITCQSMIIARPGTKSLTLNYIVKEWQTGKEVGSLTKEVNVGEDNSNLVTDIIPIRDVKLWSPESPFLYTINLSSGSDDMTVRFGMREFRFDTPTRRAYLNDKLIFLRGSNITLHRFFDDSLCQNHPWEEKWVRKLLTVLPAKYHWNCFRFCIGPVPDKWLDIADEAGLLIQNEYFIWSYRPYWDKNILKAQLTDWMRDCWNHPSVAWWDINNETHETILTELIAQLRSLDISNRPWDNGYNLPEGDNDPIEDHNYKWYSNHADCGSWDLQKFQDGTAEKTTNSPHPSAHATVLNEYGWLWLKRSGERTLLTAPIYDSIAKGITNQQRQELYGYLLAAETEYFRAHRNYAGVLHFDYLTGDFNGAITGDIFKNPETLDPVPVYDDYFSEMFKPLGVYVNFFPVEIKRESSSSIAVMLINDEYQPASGNIEMKLIDNDGKELVSRMIPFSVGSLSQQTCTLEFQFPNIRGNYWLRTQAIQKDGKKTLCRRKIKIV